MKRCLNILIIICILLAASSLKAEDRPSLPKTQGKYDWDDDTKISNQAFLEIKIFYKDTIQVYFKGEGAKKIGIYEKELTDYLKLRIRNNFADIKIVKDMREFYTKYTGKQQGGISLRIWIIGDDNPVAYHLKYTFLNYEYRYEESRPKGVRVNHSIWEYEFLGIGSKYKVPDAIKKSIDDVIPKLAILFYGVRGEL